MSDGEAGGEGRVPYTFWQPLKEVKAAYVLGDLFLIQKPDLHSILALLVMAFGCLTGAAYSPVRSNWN